MAPVARRLAERFRVLEALQRGSGGEPLTVARHVEDLHELVRFRCARPPALLGHSWGAMLALAYAAAHPDAAAALVLVGCGTFDQTARDRMTLIRKRRMSPAVRQRLGRLITDFPDPDERLEATSEVMVALDSHDLVPGRQEVEEYDARAHQETWSDLMRLEGAGVYPAAFASIRVPVVMLHGAEDPHPGRMIRAGLEPYLPQIEYHEWSACGHYPWLEKAVGEEFFTVAGGWIERQLAGPAVGSASRGGAE